MKFSRYLSGKVPSMVAAGFFLGCNYILFRVLGIDVNASIFLTIGFLIVYGGVMGWEYYKKKNI